MRDFVTFPFPSSSSLITKCYQAAEGLHKSREEPSADAKKTGLSGSNSTGSDITGPTMRKSPRGTHTFRRLEFKLILVIFILSQRQYLADARAQQQQQDSGTSFQLSQQNGFQLHQSSMSGEISADANGRQLSPSAPANVTLGPTTQVAAAQPKLDCPNGLLTFELLTGYIYKPSSGAEVLSSMPSTLQLTDCLDYCLHNSSCLAINFEMGLCVLLAQSARQRPHNLFTSQFPVFTIYAEKKCLLSGE